MECTILLGLLCSVPACQSFPTGTIGTIGMVQLSDKITNKIIYCRFVSSSSAFGYAKRIQFQHNFYFNFHNLSLAGRETVDSRQNEATIKGSR